MSKKTTHDALCSKNRVTPSFQKLSLRRHGDSTGMASDQAPDLGGLFATAAQTKPSRTYSHRGKNSRARSLPALKPTSAPTNAGVRLQRCRIGKVNSWELKPVNERSALMIQTDHGEQTTAVGNRLPPQVTDEPDNTHHGRAQETSSSSTAKCAEETMSQFIMLNRKILS